MWPNAETNVVWRYSHRRPEMLGEDEISMLVVTTDETGSLDHRHPRADHGTGCRT